MGTLSRLNPVQKGNKRFHQGYVKLIHPEKFIGDYSEKVGVPYRSGLEYRFIKTIDSSEVCIRWTYEHDAFIIPYMSPIDHRQHRYYPDFYVEVRLYNGETKRYLVEVKAQKDTQKPDPKKFKDRSSYAYQLRQSLLVEVKRRAAENWCKQHGLQYLFVTENFFSKPFN